jgi:hypothetical protein
MVEMSKKDKLIYDSLSDLGRILYNDKQLNEDTPRLQLFLSLAKMFDSELRTNLKRTSFELDDAYATGNHLAWLEFKKYPHVHKYISQYLEEEQLSLAQKAIDEKAMSKASVAVGLQNQIQDRQAKEQNTNVIVFFMPQKEYVKGGS